MASQVLCKTLLCGRLKPALAVRARERSCQRHCRQFCGAIPAQHDRIRHADGKLRHVTANQRETKHRNRPQVACGGQFGLGQKRARLIYHKPVLAGNAPPASTESAKAISKTPLAAAASRKAVQPRASALSCPGAGPCLGYDPSDGSHDAPGPQSRDQDPAQSRYPCRGNRGC